MNTITDQYKALIARGDTIDPAYLLEVLDTLETKQAALVAALENLLASYTAIGPAAELKSLRAECETAAFSLLARIGGA